jgi:hypothetical protein
MGYAAEYLAVADAIMARLAAVPEIKQVVFGEKENLGLLQFPCVFLVPGTDEVSEITNVEFRHDYSFEAVLVSRGYGDVEAGLRNIITLAGKCYDAIMADRQLGGTVYWVRVTAVDPGYGKVESGPVLYWASLHLVATKALIEG